MCCSLSVVSDSRLAAQHPYAPSAIPILGGRWQLGMSSNMDAQGIMNEVYRILRKFNFEWKVLSLYKLKARYPAGLLDRSGKPVASSEVCKIGIQLYKTSGRDASGGGMAAGAGGGASGASSASSASNTPTQSPALGPSNPLSGLSSTSPTASQIPQEPQGAFVIDMQKLCGQMFLFVRPRRFSHSRLLHGPIYSFLVCALAHLFFFPLALFSCVCVRAVGAVFEHHRAGEQHRAQRRSGRRQPTLKRACVSTCAPHLRLLPSSHPCPPSPPPPPSSPRHSTSLDSTPKRDLQSMNPAPIASSRLSALPPPSSSSL